MATMAVVASASFSTEGGLEPEGPPLAPQCEGQVIASKIRRLLECVFLTTTNVQDLDSESEDDYLLLRCTLRLLNKNQISGRKRVRKMTPFMENIIPLYSDLNFKRHFRLCRITVQQLSQQLAPKLLRMHADHPGRYPVDISKLVLYSLWVLTHHESLRGVGCRFGINHSTALKYLNFFVEAVLELNNEEEIISWPKSRRAETTMRHFEHKWNFPGVLGVIDGKHIAIKAPEDDPSSYINRKGFHSIVLQAVCDEKMLFTHCYVGEVGSVHDACVLQRSPVMNMLQDTNTFPNNSHLLGDAAYPLHKHLLTPYKDNGHLSEVLLTYNTVHSNCRCIIERAFAHLVGRFRRLTYLNMAKLDLMVKLIIACCVLHNICISSNDDAEQDECPNDYTESVHLGDGGVVLANTKRNDIANLLSVRRLSHL